MRDPKHPRQLTEDFRRQIVAPVDSGKPRAEVMREHDLGKPTLDPLDPAGPCMRLNRRRGQPRPRAEPPHRARARELQAQDGGRRLKTGGADIRTKVTVMAANAGRYPISAQCRILGAPRSAYHHMLAGPPAPPAPDPIEPDAPGALGASRGGHGARRLKAALARSGITASRRCV